MEKKTTKIIITSTLATATAISVFCFFRKDGIIIPATDGLFVGGAVWIISNQETENYFKRLERKTTDHKT